MKVWQPTGDTSQVMPLIQNCDSWPPSSDRIHPKMCTAMPWYTCPLHLFNPSHWCGTCQGHISAKSSCALLLADNSSDTNTLVVMPLLGPQQPFVHQTFALSIQSLARFFLFLCVAALASSGAKSGPKYVQCLGMSQQSLI